MKGRRVRLFSRKQREPLTHPHVRRSILVPARLDDVAARLGDFNDLHSPKHATPHTVLVGSSGDWTVVELPPTLHPSTFHHLGFWLLDTPGGGEQTILRSAAGPTHPSYSLVDDPELADCLCGVDEHGQGWTVSVPTNDIVRPEPVPARAEVPVLAGPTTTRSIEVLMEDPGHASNPANEASTDSRRRLATMADDVSHMF